MRPSSFRPLAVAISALLLVFGLVVPAQAAPDPVALVALAKGPVRSLALPQAGGSLKAARSAWVHSLDSLAAGTFLQLGEGASATLAWHADGHREDLTGPCVVQITPRGSHLVRGDKSSVRMSESEAAEALSPDGPLVRAQVNPEMSLTVQVADGMPTFSWKADSSGPYVVTVLSPGPPSVNLWTSETLQDRAGYDGPMLTPATPYTVQVTSQGRPLGALRFELESDASVRSLGAAQVEVRSFPQDAANQAMLAVTLDQRGDLQGAVQAMQAALQQQPDDAGFIRRMQSMVTEMGNEAEANKWRNRAKAVEDSIDPSLYEGGLNEYLDGVEGFYLP